MKKAAEEAAFVGVRFQALCADQILWVEEKDSAPPATGADQADFEAV